MAVAYPSQITYEQFPPYNHHVTCYIQQDYVDENETESEYESDLEFDEMREDDLDRDCEPTVADQLLNFAETVNRDIQKYFSRRKILEEKSEQSDTEKTPRQRLSGREQYYADLMKVVEGDNSLDSSKKPVESTQRVFYHRGNDSGRPSGKTNILAGLGGLEDLFDYARQTEYPHLMINDVSNRDDGLMSKAGKHRDILPWKRRNLPSSFFLEPNGERVQLFDYSTNDTPDFSDLMANIADEDTVTIPQTTPIHCQACR